jgi:peptidyl-prolyl cis-trans isomerase C
MARVTARANKSFELESLVLSTPEAARVPLPTQRIEEAMGELRGRYPHEAAFLADLAGNGLDDAVLAEALGRELIFDAVMQQVASRRPSVTELDERLFFELHKVTPPEPVYVRLVSAVAAPTTSRWTVRWFLHAH